MSESKTGVSASLINIGDDPLNTADLIDIARTRNGAAANADVFDAFEDQYMAYRHHRVAGGARKKYEAWMQLEVDRLEKDKKACGFLNVMSLNTTGDFLHTFRFRDYRSLVVWLRSDAHRDWARKGEGLCTEIGHDVSQGGAGLLPPSMSRVAQKMLNAQTKRKIAMSAVAGVENLDESVLVKAGAPSKRCAPSWGGQFCGYKFAIEGPEPEWRKSIVIWCSACMIFTPYVVWILPHVYGAFLPPNKVFEALGIPGQPDLAPSEPCIMDVNSTTNQAQFIPGECGRTAVKNDIMFWGFLFTDLIVNVLMTWFGVPCWSIMCRPFTHGAPRFAQCGCNFEPFTTMDDGLPCFRPRKQQWELVLEDTNARLKSMEKMLVAETRLRSSLRNRFKARLAKLEGGGKAVATNATRARTDSVVTAKVQRRIKAEMDSLDAQGPNGIGMRSSICIRAWVTQDNIPQAETLLHDIAKAQEESAGFKGMVVSTPSNSGAKLVVPTEPDLSTGMSPLAPFDIYFEYDTLDHLKKWMGSETRMHFLVLSGNVFRGPPEGGAPVVQVQVHDALSGLFTSGAAQARSISRLTSSRRPPPSQVLQYHPPTWKIWCCLNVAFGVVGLPMVDLFLNRAPGAPWGGWVAGPLFFVPWHPLVKVMVLMLVAVPIIVYVSVPCVLYFAHGWVFEPWPLSTNPLIAVLQEGFPCCLATGPRNEAADDDEDGVELQTF